MPAAATIRLQVESALAHTISSALTPLPSRVRETMPTRISVVDAVLEGGFPVAAISELVGPECSGRTSIALSFLAGITHVRKACAWVDVSNAFDPLCAAATGIDLARLLWVRCGVVEEEVERTTRRFSLPEQYLVPKPAKKGLHGGSFGPHPRNEVKGLSGAVTDLLRHDALAPRCAEPQHRARPKPMTYRPYFIPPVTPQRSPSPTLWVRLEQALRSTDQLLQGGGFSAIVLDMGGVAPEVVSRVPLATWFRYRAAAERTQSSILFLSQYSCAKSAAALLLRLEPAEPLCDESTVFTGVEHRAEVARRRFAENAPIAPRKPPQNVNAASWQSRTVWAGRR